MGLEKSTRDVVLADGTAVRADMLAIGGKDLNAYAGLNGPYWVDADFDGVPESVNPRAFGLVMEDVDFGLALFAPKQGQAQVADLKWAAATATAGRVEFVGLQDVTLKVSNIGLDINLVTGVAAGVDSDAKVIDFAGGEGQRKIQVINGPVSTIALDHDGRLGQYVRATGDVELRVGDFFEVEGSLGFERRSQTVTLADGSSVDTELISIGGTDLSAFVGVGPYRKDLNLDGKVDVRTTFDDAGQRVKEEMDGDFDGRTDWVDHYISGKRTVSEVDTDFNGTFDLFKYYENSKVRRKERDTNADGRVDAWEYLDENGTVVKTGKDVDGDGKMDVREQ
jgi:hypothetical protein